MLDFLAGVGYTCVMPKRSSKKRARDPNVLAAQIVAEATGEKPRPDPEVEVLEIRLDHPPEEAKNPHAQALGRLGGKKGGKARAAKLSAKRRREIASKAARARWNKRKKPANP